MKGPLQSFLTVTNKIDLIDIYEKKIKSKHYLQSFFRKIKYQNLSMLCSQWSWVERKGALPKKMNTKISVMDFWIHASFNNLRQESLELFYILYIKVSKSTLKNFKGENEKKKCKSEIRDGEAMPCQSY